MRRCETCFSVLISVKPVKMPTKPEYETYTHFQLQRILKKRHLRVSGSKAELVTRLTGND